MLYNTSIYYLIFSVILPIYYRRGGGKLLELGTPLPTSHSAMQSGCLASWYNTCGERYGTRESTAPPQSKKCCLMFGVSDGERLLDSNMLGGKILGHTRFGRQLEEHVSGHSQLLAAAERHAKWVSLPTSALPSISIPLRSHNFSLRSLHKQF